MLTDAAKRKTLPAWIREGLEKMEREKQKKMERERMEQEKKEAEKREQAEKEAMDDMTNDGEPHVPKKSRFVSEWGVSNLLWKDSGAVVI